MHVLVATIYVVVVIIAVHLVGYWVLIPGIGLPVLYVIVFIVRPGFKRALEEGVGKARKEVFDIVEQGEPTGETQIRAEKAAILLGVKVNKGRGRIMKGKNGLFYLSKKYIGKFLAHLLRPSYPERVFQEIAVSLKGHYGADGHNDLTEVIDYIKELNPEAAGRIEAYL